MFSLIEEFAGYGFNKSHSVGYTLLAYQTAYLKTYFPVQYMAAVLTYTADSTDKLVKYVDECARVKLPDGRTGIEVGTPDIDRSGVRFHVVFEPGEERRSGNGHIRFGLSAVKGVGEKAVHAILEARNEGGPFRSLWNFCRRVPLQLVNRTAIDALIKSGAFDGVHGKDERAAMLQALEPAIKTGQRAAADRESGQSSLLFGSTADAGEEDEPEQDLPSVPPWSATELLAHEKEALGFFATSHPLDDHRELLERFGNVNVEQLKALPADTEVVLGALLGGIRTTRTRKGRNPGQKMAIVQLEDRSDRIEGVLFADAYAEHEAALDRGAVLFFTGRVDRRREDPNLLVSKVIGIAEAEAKLTRRLRIHLDGTSTAGAGGNVLGDDLERLRDLLDRHRHRGSNGRPNGGVEVEFRIELDDMTVTAGANGSRAPVDQAVKSEIEELLGARGHCEYVGPPPPGPR